MLKPKWILLTFSLFLLLSLLFFPRKTAIEMVLLPQSHQEIEANSPVESLLEDEILWLATQNWLVSLDSSMGVQRRLPRVLSQESWSTQGVSQRFQDQWHYYPLGGEPWLLSQEHPWYMVSRGNLFSTEGFLTFSYWEQPEAPQWSRDLPGALSAYCSSDNRIILGFTNGIIHILDRQGNLLQQFEPGGSRISVIYGLAISPNGRQLALLSGLSPQRVLVLEEKNSDYRPIYHRNLETQFRRPVVMGYPEKGDFFYYENQQGVSLFYPAEERHLDLELEGKVVDLHFDAELEAPVILSHNQGSYRLEAFLNDKLLFHRSLNCEYARLYQMDQGLLLVQDDSLMELKWSRE